MRQKRQLRPSAQTALSKGDEKNSPGAFIGVGVENENEKLSKLASMFVSRAGPRASGGSR